MKILFMCVANSARSQLAEALGRKIFGSHAWIESAGSEPKSVNPFASAVLKESGIDNSKQFSKFFDQLNVSFKASIDYVITLCAEEVCPSVVSKTAKRLHWPIPDPAGQSGSHEAQLNRFRIARGNIEAAIFKFRDELRNRASL